MISLEWGYSSTNNIHTGRNEILDAAIVQLSEYFAEKRISFDVPLAPKGTEFQKSAWQELLKIPYGKVINYGEQAKRLGKPKAARAVGAANGKNPIGIMIPCHRVIGSSGSLTGFAGGLEIKAQLLSLEANYISRNS